MIDHASVAAWLDNYVHAWKTYDPDDIRSLFSEDARYYYTPFHDPIVGRKAIAAWWFEYRDAPGTYDAAYKPLAVEGNITVANGYSRYFEADGATLKSDFDNIFVLRFDDHDTCVEFRDWAVKR